MLKNIINLHCAFNIKETQVCVTASLSAQKDFLGGGVVKNNPIFVKQILLHHIYANIWEFIWTKCVTHLLVFLI